MKTELTINERDFIEKMKLDKERARLGYELLIKKRKDFVEFFDHLRNAGFFDPAHNLGPQPAKEPGYVYVPFWEALDYLLFQVLGFIKPPILIGRVDF